MIELDPDRRGFLNRPGFLFGVRHNGGVVFDSNCGAASGSTFSGDGVFVVFGPLSESSSIDNVLFFGDPAPDIAGGTISGAGSDLGGVNWFPINDAVYLRLEVDNTAERFDAIYRYPATNSLTLLALVFSIFPA